MLARLFVLFTVLSLLELFLLVKIGGEIGVGPTLLLILVTGVLGAWLTKREGLRVFREYQRAIQELRMPDEGLTSGLLLLVGGGLLIAPGVLSDICGLLLMIPPVRRVVARWVEAYVRERYLGEVAVETSTVSGRRVVRRVRVEREEASAVGAASSSASSGSNEEVLEPDLVVDRRGRVVAHLED